MLKLPLTLAASGGLAVLPADSPADVAQSLALLLDTLPGERRSVPGYGLPDQMFAQQHVVDAAVAAAVEDWEPRATPVAVDLATAGADRLITVHPREEA